MKKVIYKCRNIHRFSDRKNVKLFATCEMFRDVSYKRYYLCKTQGKIYFFSKTIKLTN